MSRLRHKKSGGKVMAGALTGVHRLEVDKPHPFKPDEEKKHGGKIHGKHEHHKLGRKRGGSVKKKSDGGNVTTVAKTKETGPDDYPTVSGRPLLADTKYNAPADKYFQLPYKTQQDIFGLERRAPGKIEERPPGRAKGGRVGQDGKPSEHGIGNTPDRGRKFGTNPPQGVPMADETTPRGKYGYGKGTIEDSLKDGGKVKWIQGAIKHPGAEKKAAHKAGLSTHAFMEKHKHDSGKSGARARLGLRLSAMHKHKD